ncbi:MAG: hypothetical protein JW860_09760 [Sedimentisphaerales bacterium]|nr:hypothetical protein [Sedimentisphaerales bacterium]
MKIYGAWLATGNIAIWFTLVDAGLSDLIRQRCAQAYGSGDAIAAGKSIGTGLILTVFISLAPVLLGAILCPFIPRIFDLQGLDGEVIRLAFFLATLATSLALISNAAGAAQQGLQRNISFTVIYVFGSLFSIATCIVLLFRGYGVLAIPLGMITKSLISIFSYWFNVFWICKRVGISIIFCKHTMKEFGGLMTWTSINRFAYNLFYNCDAFIVGLLMGAESTPIYVLTKRVWDMVNYFSNRIGLAFMPGLAHLHGEGHKEKFKQISYRLLRTAGWIIAIGSGICLCLNAKFIALWVGKELYAGHVFNLLMSVAIIFQILLFIINRILYGADNIVRPSQMGTLVYLCKAVCLVVLIWMIGFMGGPISILIAFGLIGMRYFVVQLQKSAGFSKKEMRRYFLNLLRTVAITHVTALLFSSIAVDTWGIFILVGVMYFSTVIILLFICDLEFREEIHYFRYWLMKLLDHRLSFYSRN